MKVMLVDDEEWCLEELAEILSEVKCFQLTGLYNSGEKALESALKDVPDVIFIDVQIPGMSGLELARKLKVVLPDIFIILMSENECFARNGFDIGVDDYVLKPLRKERVLKALERVGQLSV